MTLARRRVGAPPRSWFNDRRALTPARRTVCPRPRSQPLKARIRLDIRGRPLRLAGPARSTEQVDLSAREESQTAVAATRVLSLRRMYARAAGNRSHPGSTITG